VAPGAVTFSNVTSNSVTINWGDTNLDEMQYIVERSTDNFATNVTAVGTVGINGTSITDNTVQAGTTYQYRVHAENFDSIGAYATGTVTPTGVTPPNLLSTTIGDGTAQRSEVRSIKLTFDHAVTLGAGAVTLNLLNSGGSGANDNSAPTDASAALGTPTSSDGGITWTIPIKTSTAFSDATGSLSDGIFTVTIHAANVTDASNNTLAGGDKTTTFHRLFGDINGSKNVNNTDFGNFRNAFNTTTGNAAYVNAFDSNNDGVINNADFGQFRNRFNKVFTY
jgi:hypothetical protein